MKLGDRLAGKGLADKATLFIPARILAIRMAGKLIVAEDNLSPGLIIICLGHKSLFSDALNF